MTPSLLLLPLLLPQADTTLVSLGLNGYAAAGASGQPSVSAEARWIAFSSLAPNLVANDANSLQDIFVLDRRVGGITRASVSSAGTPANNHAIFPRISADGRWVSFQSFASNLVAGDGNGLEDIFLRDLQTNTTECVSVSPQGAPGSGGPTGPFFPYETASALSAEGRWVVFASAFTNLVPGDTNAVRDIFLRDRQSNTTRRVSVSSSGVQANGGSRWPVITRDGRWIAFQSSASNLVAGDTNGKADIFLHDTLRGTTELVSRAHDGAPANADCEQPTLSESGLRVAFSSVSSNLIPGDTNGQFDIFVRELDTRITRRVSVGQGGVQSNGNSHAPELSANGRYLAYWSLATNHVAADLNARADVFRTDLDTGTTVRVSLSETGAEVGDNSTAPAISADARFVSWESTGFFVPNDFNSQSDVLLRDTASFLPATACVAGNDSAGCTPRMRFSGVAVLSQPGALLIEAAPVRNQSIGTLLYSLRGAWQPFRTGVLCIDTPLSRTPLQISGGSPSAVVDCSGAFGIDFKQWIGSGVPGNLLPGTVVHCQYWYREAVPGIGPVDRFSDSGYFELAP